MSSTEKFHRPAAVLRGGDVDLRDPGSLIFDGVADEVLEELNQLQLVGEYHRQRIVSHERATFFDRASEVE